MERVGYVEKADGTVDTETGPSDSYSFEKTVRDRPQVAHHLRARVHQQRARIHVWFRENRNPDWHGDMTPVTFRMGGGPTRLQMGGALVENPGPGRFAEMIVYVDELREILKLVENEDEVIRTAERLFMSEIKAYVREFMGSGKKRLGGVPVDLDALSDNPMEWPEKVRWRANQVPSSCEAHFRRLAHRDPLPLARVEVVEENIAPPRDVADMKLQQIVDSMGGGNGGANAAVFAKSFVQELIDQGAIHVKRPPGRPRKNGNGDDGAEE